MASESSVGVRGPGAARPAKKSTPKRPTKREPFSRHQRTVESVLAEMRRLEHMLRRPTA